MSIASDYMHQAWCANWRRVPAEEVAPEMVEVLEEIDFDFEGPPGPLDYYEGTRQPPVTNLPLEAFCEGLTVHSAQEQDWWEAF